MRPDYLLVTAPEGDPITTEEASEHVRIDSTDDILYLQSLIQVATEYVEMITGRVFSQSTWRVVAPSWSALESSIAAACAPYSMPLFRAPLVSVSSVKYYASGEESLTTLDASAYRVITTREPGMVQLIDAPPSVEDRSDAVQIEFVAGYSDPTSAPDMLRHAVKMMVCHLYEQRAHVNIGNIVTRIPDTVPMMLQNQKIAGWIA